MQSYIDLTPEDNNGRVGVAFADERYWFYPRWNARENEEKGAWFLDIREEDDTTIVVAGMKLMLGALLGRRCSHAFFKKHNLQLVDLSNSGIDMGFDDLGSRVVLLHQTLTDFFVPAGAL